MKKEIFPIQVCLTAIFLLGSCTLPAERSEPSEKIPTAIAPERPKMPVEVSEVKRENLTEILELTGTVKPWDEFEISSEITGTVKAIYCDEGDWVEKGDILLELDRTKLELQFEARKADLKKSEIELEFARKHLVRAEALLEKGAISQSEVDNLRERANLAESTVEVSRLSVRAIEEDLRDTRLFSPAAGQVSRRFISLGETVTAASALFKLIQLQPIKVLTEIAEPYLAVVRPGQQVQLEFDALPDDLLVGRVYKIQPIANVESGAFPLEIRLSNVNRNFQVGMIARVELSGKVYAEALVVPLESIVNSQGEDFVFVVSEGRAERRAISVRERIGQWAVVDADLEPGEKVVTRGNSNLTDGQPVELIV